MMRKLFLLFSSFIFIFLMPIQSSASVSYKTETLTADGKVVETQAAYIPVKLFGSSIEMIHPEDIYIDDQNHVYIVDSGTKLVTQFDENEEVVQIYGEGILDQPVGIYVDSENYVYVADYEKQSVLKFQADGELVMEYAKPDSPLFGVRSPYKPQKLSVDKRGNLYIISEGSTNGIIQLNQDGEFLGYYGVNTTRPSVGEVIRNLLTTERQKLGLFMKTPPSPTSITLDEKGIIYTVTSGTSWESVRKLNIAGSNMFHPDIAPVTNLIDIAIGPIGNVYTIGVDGIIYEFDRNGNLLFIFGGRDDGSNRLGLIQQPSSIGVDNVGRLYVSDRENGLVQLYEPTQFTTILHEGLALYGDGHYVKSETFWNEILRLNSSFGLAHIAKGESLYKQQQYKESLKEFELGNDKVGYSEAFWEVRNEWLQKHLSKLIIIIVFLVIFRFVLKFAHKKYNLFHPIQKLLEKLKNITLIQELLFLGKFITKPIDSMYDLKEYKRASVISATILYIVLMIEYILSIYWTGFIFKGKSLDDVNVFLEITILIIPILLFVVTNYMVSTITEGEGRFRDVYIGTIYNLAPVILFILPITLVSNILTFNESFIYDFSLKIIIAWALVLVFVMIKEIHDYTFFGTIQNIFVTLFGMFIIVLVFFVIYVLFDQVYQFAESIIQEVVRRV